MIVEQQYFINVADFGLGAEVVKRVSSIPSQNRGTFFYHRGLVSTLFHYRSKRVRIVVDDHETIEGNFLIGAVANGGIFGQGMMIAPNARINDGYFDLVLLEDMREIEILWNSRRLYAGSIDKHKKVHTIRAKKIKVQSENPVSIECDGEPGGNLPAKFEIREQAINFRIRYPP